MRTRIERTEFEQGRRVLALSDIHGHLKTLNLALDKARYCPDDILVVVGDMIEKGAQSLGVVRKIMALSQKGTVYALTGNVDMWMTRFLLSGDPETQHELVKNALNAKKWWGGTTLEEMCAELNLPFDEKMNIAQTLFQVRRRYSDELSFLNGLPTILDTPAYRFVHGGLPHENLALLDGTDNHPLVRFDHFFNDAPAFQKYIVVGHWPVALYREKYPDENPLIDEKRRIICLDGGCGVKCDGQLNVLTLPENAKGPFPFVSADTLPVITALDDQTPGPDDPVYIKWTDHAITVLEQTTETARIRFHDRVLTVPAALLMKKDGDTICDDVTTYRLPVQKGDHLHLVFSTKDALYVKKDGVSGWYAGGWERT